IRRYDGRAVDGALLDSLLARAAHAPPTGNMQLYSVIVSASPEEKAALAPMHFNQPQVMGCGVVLTFCADLHRFSRWCEARQAEPCYDNFQSLVAAFLDTVAFAQQFNTVAEQAGLGVCWLGTTTYNAPEIAATLGLPPLVVPVITLTVGYPAEDGSDVGRLPVEALIHHGSYRDYTADDIDRLYHEKESRVDSQQFVAENGKSTLAQVFTDVRYPRANNELFSEKFLTYLRGCGLL
ncbi:MAG: nitroreductase family protein, partial [Muribaculaceae bacterium]|nr:nitroreductase family protein [Muribaculaceae bacterium]